MSRFRFFVCTVSVLLTLPASLTFASQSYPKKPVRMVVPFSPGSNSDVVARILARGLSQSFEHEVVVDNRSGGGGNIGAQMVARAAPDGHAMLLVNLSHAANALLYRTITYDLRRDFAPVTQVATSPAVLVLFPLVPAKALGEFIKMAKARPGDVAYSSAGIGSPSFIAGELFKDETGIDLLHVPYRSGGEAITAVSAGEVSAYFAPLVSALPSIREGKLRALAVTSSKRVPMMPQYPTVAELGYPGYVAGNWYGLAVPVKTSTEIIASIRGAALNALEGHNTREALSQLGYILVGDEPDDFSAHIDSEIDKLKRILSEVRRRWRALDLSASGRD